MTMQITYDEEKFKNFYSMIQQHDFKEYQGLTSKYKAFEVPNLTKDMTLEMLQKLNPSTAGTIPTYQSFWKWYKKNLGEQTLDIFAKHLWPNKCDNFDALKKEMMENGKHEFWQHISARVYKKWCSIITESQCLYSIVEAVEKTDRKWRVITAPKMDVTGIDFAIIHANYITPFQIKKDTRSKIASGKQNSSENFSRSILGKYANIAMNGVISDLNLHETLTPSVLIKYDTKKSGELPYTYLREYDNGFVYFNGESLIDQLTNNIKEFSTKKLKIR